MVAADPDDQPRKVLVVEDSLAIGALLCQQLDFQGFSPLHATTLAEAKTLCADHADELFVAILDLTLPDAMHGEVVDYVQGQGIPLIVLTGNYDDDLRERLLARNIIDYVIKQSSDEIEQVVELVRHLRDSRTMKVLVVDDSAAMRQYFETLLVSRLFEVVSAVDGAEALACLEAHAEICLMITDFNMPGMDGLELTRAVRRQHSRHELAIIGLSIHGSGTLTAQFLKAGANDFITYPFLVEEFHCRVAQNIDLIQHIRNTEEMAQRDPLTRLNNRRYLFEAGCNLLENMRRGHIRLNVAMIDVDYFKKVNDRYGHQAGDMVLVKVAEALQATCRQGDLLARYGGEEFCLLSVNVAVGGEMEPYERARRAIEQIELEWEGQAFGVTASLGVCTQPRDTLDAMLADADEALYQAKAEGRNRVVLR